MTDGFHHVPDIREALGGLRLAEGKSPAGRLLTGDASSRLTVAEMADTRIEAARAPSHHSHSSHMSHHSSTVPGHTSHASHTSHHSSR